MPEEGMLLISHYIDNFFFISNRFKFLAWLKSVISHKYNVKDLVEVKTIIRRQVTRNLNDKAKKINQTAFIRDLFDSKYMTVYNAVAIRIKTGYFIEM